MPLYEYYCCDCGHEVELIRKFSEAELTVCPACHKQSLSRKTSRTSFHLKGGGWYKDAYSNVKKPAAQNNSASKSTPEKNSKSKTTATKEKSSSKGATSNPPKQT